MKKIIVSLMVIALCISLSACGEVPIQEAIVGTWEREPHEIEVDVLDWGDLYVDATRVEIYEIYQGGTGKHLITDTPGTWDVQTYDCGLTWSIQEDIVNIEFEYFGYDYDYHMRTKGFVYDEEANTLTSVDGTIVLHRK